MKKIVLFILVIFYSSLSFGQTESSLFWKIEGNGIEKPSYILGTAHIPEMGVFKQNESIIPLMLSCELFVSELELSEDAGMKEIELLMLPLGQYMSDYYTEAEFELIKREYGKRGLVDIEDLKMLQPFILVQFLKNESEPGHDQQLSIDEYLHELATNEGKEIFGLETIFEQTQYLVNSQKTKRVYNFFKNIDKFPIHKEMLLSAYHSQNLDSLQLLAEDTVFNVFDTKILVDKRNQLWFPKIDSLIRKKSAFIAVGAGHLPGSNGILQRLKDVGYNVSPERADSKSQRPANSRLVWQKYVSQNNKFSILFPGEPEVGSQKSQKSDGQHVTNLYEFNLGRNNEKEIGYGVFEFIDPTIKPYNSRKEAEKFISTFIDKMINEDAKLISSSKYRLEGRYGANLTIKLTKDDKLVHGRIVLLSDRYFFLSAFSRSDLKDFTPIETFLNSFKLLE